MADEAPSAPVGNTESRSWLELVKEFILIPVDKKVLTVAPEIGHLAPILFTMGSLFFAIVTLNYPVAVFAASSVEASIFYNLISPIADYIATPFSGIDSSASDRGSAQECRSYFSTLTPSRFQSLIGKGLVRSFPNYPLYYLSFAVTYCIQGLLMFRDEASNMGPKYSNRPYMSLIAGTMFLILYSLYLYVFGCDSLLSLVFSAVIGIIIGYLIVQQNMIFLGKPSVDLLFIPPLVKRSGMDYVCVTTPAA
jgi:hypothetical protein